jgi:hypothetical protein
MAASSAAAKKANPKQLRLRTGFSRQFSDDLPTPTAITDLVRMIEDIDEKPEIVMEEDSVGGTSDSSHGSSPVTVHPAGAQRGKVSNRNLALNNLQLNLAAAQQQQAAVLSSSKPPSVSSLQSTPSTESPSTMNGEKLTYAGIVGKPAAPTQGGLMPDPQHIEPQTPRTPSGFVTPGGGEAMDDPFMMLRNLPI